MHIQFSPEDTEHFTLLLKLHTLFRAYFRGKRRPAYGLSIQNASPNLTTIDVTLRFLSGETYCCDEPDCHLPRGRKGILQFAESHNFPLPANVTIRWHCIVEQGARLRLLSQLGIPPESKPHEYDHILSPQTDPPPFIPPPAPPENFTGIWTLDRHNGARTEIEYQNGIPNGSYKEYASNNICLREGSKQNNLWHGPLITRNAKGKILDVSNFTNGTGTYRIFNANGHLVDEIPFLAGKRHGPVRHYRNRKLFLTCHCENGQCSAAILEG